MTQNFYYGAGLPELLDIQRSSFCWFLANGLSEELSKFSSIFDLTGNLELKVYGQEYKLKESKFTKSEAIEKNSTYSMRLYVPVKILKFYSKAEIINESHIEQIAEKQSVFIGEIPLMTNKGTFIINGCERIVINQLIRSSGVFYKKEKKKNNLTYLYSGTVITKKGSWLTFELDDECLWVRIDKKYKTPINWFLAALDLTNDEVYGAVKNKIFLGEVITSLKNQVGDKNLSSDNDFSTVNNVVNKNNNVLSIDKVREILQTRILNTNFYDLGEVGRIKINQKLGLNVPLETRILTANDILKIIDYLINLKFHTGEVDDIDSLKNRRIRCVGELLQLQVRVGLNRLERSVSEKLTICDLSSVKLTNLVNAKPLITAMKEFFGSSQLSQFMDETNPLAELTHKRRISALGPGGLSTDHVTFAARDIHPTQYGRLCPIETPEGQNAGLITSLASYAKVNKYGFIETPFYEVEKGQIKKNHPIIHLTAEEERFFKIASSDLKINSEGYIENTSVPVRYNQEFLLVPPQDVNLITVSPIQTISIAAALIPFLEHDDANRALMGSNMQRQAVPLLYPQKPIVGTGLEGQIAADAGTGVVSYLPGKIKWVCATEILIDVDTININNHIKDLTKYSKYKLQKYRRSNQDTCLNQKPIVWPGQYIESGQVIADGPGTEDGELALGQNLTVAYMPWEGYNYEDAILVSEKLLYNNLFTSVHIEKYEIEVKQTKAGPEYTTMNVPNTPKNTIRHLDENGIIHKGALVQPNDVLVGKVTPKGESDQLPEGKLLKAIFGEKIPDVRDTSLRVPKGIYGRVLDVLIFTKDNGDEVPAGAIAVIRIFIAQIRKIRIGDKIAGRHGNKGIVSRILPIQDMPYLPDGNTVDLIFNPLGVPSRMNVGQIFECLLGLAGENLNKRFKILPFDEMYASEASRILINNKLKQAAIYKNKPWLFNPSCPGKITLIDGRSGESFDNPVLVGKSYILKLIHLVDDKIHARSTGPYSLVTQQPVGGKSQQGGQRFGEMEVWALEAFGAAYTLQEILTIKSDDMKGRNEVINSIVRGQTIPKPCIPESFKVLLRELQALGLDITTYKFKRLETGEISESEVDLMAST